MQVGKLVKVISIPLILLMYLIVMMVYNNYEGYNHSFINNTNEYKENVKQSKQPNDRIEIKPED